MKADFPNLPPPLTSTTPLVSVIIGNYNYGRYIGQAIDSVLSQTYPHVELVVVDDGSVDDSRPVIENYGDRLISIFQENAGQGPAFTAGLARSRGEIVCFLDSDDYFHPEKVSRVVEAFRQHPKWVQLSHGRVTVDRDGNKIGRDPTFFSCGDVRSLLLGYGRYAWAVTSALSYRRWALEFVLPIPPRPRAADTYLTTTVPFLGQVGSISEQLMYRRQHGTNRRAQSDNVNYLIEQRLDSRDCINLGAQIVGLAKHFDIERDADYLSYLAANREHGSITDFVRVLWLTFGESLAIGQGIKDTLERLIRRGSCAITPRQGKAILKLGPKRYLLSKFSGTSPSPKETGS